MQQKCAVLSFDHVSFYSLILHFCFRGIKCKNVVLVLRFIPKCLEMAVLHKLCLAVLLVHTQSSKIQNNEEGKASICKRKDNQWGKTQFPACWNSSANKIDHKIRTTVIGLTCCLPSSWCLILHSKLITSPSSSSQQYSCSPIYHLIMWQSDELGLSWVPWLMFG